nr:unnamed protein product [Spirometra erinaceieuropaei]
MLPNKKFRVSSTPSRENKRLGGSDARTGIDRMLQLPLHRPDCLLSPSAPLDSSSSDPATWPSTLEDASVTVPGHSHYQSPPSLSSSSGALDLRVNKWKTQDASPLSPTNTVSPQALGSPGLPLPANFNDPPIAISWNLALVNAFFRGFLQRRLSPPESAPYATPYCSTGPPIEAAPSMAISTVPKTLEPSRRDPSLESPHVISEGEVNGDFGRRDVGRFASPPNVSSTLTSDGGKESVIFYDPEPADRVQKIRELLRNRDPRLKYVNDGAAIKNPFAVDRKVQISVLTEMLCYVNEQGQYTCRGCDRVSPRLRSMQQHLLSHSASKFNLCVQCLKGFNDKYDMKRHTRKHTFVKPYRCPECSRSFTQRCSLEGHRKKIHHVRLDYARNERRESVRVCERCGFSCAELADLLQHTESLHPGDPGLPRLRRQLARQQQQQKERRT